MICPVCKGEGVIEVELSRKADKNSDLPKHDGWRYRTKVCHRCKGTGEIGEG